MVMFHLRSIKKKPNGCKLFFTCWAVFRTIPFLRRLHAAVCLASAERIGGFLSADLSEKDRNLEQGGIHVAGWENAFSCREHHIRGFVQRCASARPEWATLNSKRNSAADGLVFVEQLFKHHQFRHRHTTSSFYGQL